jgi:hypothetical protein
MKDFYMRRFAGTFSCLILLNATFCPRISHAQSLADAARQNRQQQAHDGTAKVIDSDDLTAASDDPIIHLVPGTTSTGGGTLLAPGLGKHSYLANGLDATKFANGGVLHIAITLGEGPSEASFDLFPQGARLPETGLPNPLASAHGVKSGTTAKIDYRFDHGAVFRLAAEGSWSAKAGDTNNYSFAVWVSNR